MYATAEEAFSSTTLGTSISFSTTPIGSNFSQNRMTISHDGNIGINTASPSEKLDVMGSIQYTGALKPNGNAGTNGYVLTSTGGGSNTWTDPSTLLAGSYIQNQNSSDQIANYRINGNGQLGGKLIIGSSTIDPTGDIQFGGGGSRRIVVQRAITGTSGSQLTLQSGGAPSGSTNGSGGTLILRGGQSTGSSSFSDVAFETFTPSGTSGSADNTVSEKMRLKANGNLGIGTTTPKSKLQVVGDIGLGNGTTITNEAITIVLTNNTGAVSVFGDIVIVDPNADNSFNKTTSTGHTSVVGVVYEGGVSPGSPCRIAISGVVQVRADVSTSRGQHVITSTTAGRAGSVSIPGAGTSIGLWLEAVNAGSLGRVLLK
jgi:hypothetical protein